MTQDWIVTYYDKKDNAFENYEIKGRTKHEAENEVMADVERRSDVEDWTMMPKE